MNDQHLYLSYGEIERQIRMARIHRSEALGSILAGAFASASQLVGRAPTECRTTLGRGARWLSRRPAG
jgi:hypothetical protein